MGLRLELLPVECRFHLKPSEGVVRGRLPHAWLHRAALMLGRVARLHVGEITARS
jgi:hypothetical protein